MPNPLKLLWIQQQVQTGNYYYSNHGDTERQRDNLTIGEIEQAIDQGHLLEEYGDTGRGESCLLVGFTNKGKPIHIVCGRYEESLIIITVYIPTPPKFITPYERG